jgi:hypothetical protein
MFESLIYIAKTISQEIEDQFTIIREIVYYYREEFRENIKTKEQMLQIKAAMGKANSYQDWRRVSTLYDQLPIVEQQVGEVYSPYYDYEYLQELVKYMT